MGTGHYDRRKSAEQLLAGDTGCDRCMLCYACVDEAKRRLKEEKE